MNRTGIYWADATLLAYFAVTTLYDYFTDDLEEQIETTNTALNAIQTLNTRVGELNSKINTIVGINSNN